MNLLDQLQLNLDVPLARRDTACSICTTSIISLWAWLSDIFEYAVTIYIFIIGVAQNKPCYVIMSFWYQGSDVHVVSAVTFAS